MRRDDEGVRLLERAKDRFQKGEQFRLELILARVIRHAGLKMRVNNILRPKVLKHNPTSTACLSTEKKTTEKATNGSSRSGWMSSGGC